MVAAQGNAFERAIAVFEPALPLAVGFSGGADSTALIAACAARWPGDVQAFHVHHGLQSAADDFERHCVEVCARLAVPFVGRRVDARHASGDSPEATARDARYAAFRDMAGTQGGRPSVASIAIGHHADDQVETMLLALSRGAGLPGLAAMPAIAVRLGLTIHRPLLGVAAADIRAWLIARDLPWIEDPTNADERYTRNRIRAVLLPALEQTFPQFRSTFTRSAAHAAEAQTLLKELGAQDLVQVGDPPRIAALQLLTRARQINVLRHWLRESHARSPSARQVDQLIEQIVACTTRGHHIHIKVADGFAVRHGAHLHWYNF